jgi:hypothetical protein
MATTKMMQMTVTIVPTLKSMLDVDAGAPVSCVR